MASYGAGKYGRAVDNNAIALQGFRELQAALKATESGVEKEVQIKIRAIGERVALVAAGNVQHKTGRDGDPRIEDAMKVSVIQRGASIYTMAVHGGAQNVGAWTKGGRGPHIKRADASHYMDRAVTQLAPWVVEQTNLVLDWIETTFETGA